jgi:tetratricopeptide (TPR) repeat protein
VPELTRHDQIHVKAAEGWLGLGNIHEAQTELDKVPPEQSIHPDILEIRWTIYTIKKDWKTALDIACALLRIAPERLEAWTHRSFCLHKLKRTKEALDGLLPALEKFPEEYIIQYNIACYACQLGDLKQAFNCLEKAIDAAGREDIRQMALEDPDLEPLWIDIGEI